MEAGKGYVQCKNKDNAGDCTQQGFIQGDEGKHQPVHGLISKGKQVRQHKTAATTQQTAQGTVAKTVELPTSFHPGLLQAGALRSPLANRFSQGFAGEEVAI